MKPLILGTALLAIVAPINAQADDGAKPTPKEFKFEMTVSTGAAKCLPRARARVVDRSLGTVEDLDVYVSGLPPHTGFDLFSIQVPDAPFGLSWYVGDIQTDEHGDGVGHFVGRFNIETFIVSPDNAGPSPNVFKSPPAVLPQATTGVKKNPVQIYHLGLWFNSPQDARKAGCPNTATPFNGEHHAGIQVLNTAKFPKDKGPLFNLK